MIIGITVIVMQAINSTIFFSDSNFKDMALKSLMFVGCGTFLLTGSQVVNRFIGSNVSANSGREQLMSLMSYGHALSTATHIDGNVISGATSFGLGVGASALGRVGGKNLLILLEELSKNLVIISKVIIVQTLIQSKVVFKMVLKILLKNLVVKLKIQHYQILVKIWVKP